MTRLIIQWNYHGFKASYELLLLLAELNSTTICLEETLKKNSNKPNTKTFEQRASGGVSILIRKTIPQNKINNAHLREVAESPEPCIKLYLSALYVSHFMTP